MVLPRLESQHPQRNPSGWKPHLAGYAWVGNIATSVLISHSFLLFSEYNIFLMLLFPRLKFNFSSIWTLIASSITHCFNWYHSSFIFFSFSALWAEKLLFYKIIISFFRVAISDIFWKAICCILVITSLWMTSLLSYMIYSNTDIFLLVK